MSRVDLHKRLEELLRPYDVKLYFQPPANIRMEYPCLIYELNSSVVQYANNKPYDAQMAYQLMLITKEPDEEVTAKLISEINFCSFDRFYISDNLYHYVFTCYEKLWQGGK